MKKILLILAVSALSLYGCDQTTNTGVDSTEQAGQLDENNLENSEAQELELESEMANVPPVETEEKPSEESETELKTTEIDVSENKETTEDKGILISEAIDLAAEDLQTSPDTLKVLIALVKDKKVDLGVYYDGILYDYEIKNSRVEEKSIEAELEQDLVDEFFVGNDALRIALEDAGLSLEEVKDIGIDFESENNKYYYEISFENSSSDFEYKIDARTGEILEIN